MSNFKVYLVEGQILSEYTVQVFDAQNAPEDSENTATTYSLQIQPASRSERPIGNI